jgi:hypothetical protein
MADVETKHRSAQVLPLLLGVHGRVGVMWHSGETSTQLLGTWYWEHTRGCRLSQ